MYPHLFSGISVGGKELKNRLTMAPLYLGYAGEGGTVSELSIDHYRLMARSGVGMVVALVAYERGEAMPEQKTMFKDWDLMVMATLGQPQSSPRRSWLVRSVLVSR